MIKELSDKVREMQSKKPPVYKDRQLSVAELKDLSKRIRKQNMKYGW